jgi:hypothetical protein
LGTISHQSLCQMGCGRLSALDCPEHVEGNAFPLFIHFAIPFGGVVDKNSPYFQRLVTANGMVRPSAPPVIEAGKGCQRQGARHVSEAKRRDSDSRHRYRQELIPKVRLWNGILHRRRIGKFIRQGIIKDEVSVLLQATALRSMQRRMTASRG